LRRVHKRPEMRNRKGLFINKLWLKSKGYKGIGEIFDMADENAAWLNNGQA
jgi:hypothetical protein